MDLFSNPNYYPKNKSVIRLINSFEQNYHPVFLKVKSQWLPQIREFLREETGLKMHQKVIGTKIHKDTNVSFYFETDRDSKFIQLIDENYPDLDFDEYASFNALYSQLKYSKKYFEQNAINPQAPFNELLEYFEEYFKKYNLDELINTLFISSGRTADIWGMYTLKGSKIEIFYIPLILFSQIKNVPLEHAILSTLVHEMAHAYHHQGKDKDNIIWHNMSSTDLKIVEGMAEYFTYLFVETYKEQYPLMKITYDTMFNCLGDEYTIFKKWTEVYSKEAIKTALLSTRKKSITRYEDFEKLLSDVKKIMH